MIFGIVSAVPVSIALGIAMYGPPGRWEGAEAGAAVMSAIGFGLFFGNAYWRKNFGEDEKEA